MPWVEAFLVPQMAVLTAALSSHFQVVFRNPEPGEELVHPPTFGGEGPATKRAARGRQSLIFPAFRGPARSAGLVGCLAPGWFSVFHGALEAEGAVEPPPVD